MNQLPRTLIWAGAALIAAGVLLHFAGRLPFRLGRLPGDLVIRGKHGTLYLPIVTCLLLSAILSIAAALFRKR